MVKVEITWVHDIQDEQVQTSPIAEDWTPLQEQWDAAPVTSVVPAEEDIIEVSSDRSMEALQLAEGVDKQGRDTTTSDGGNTADPQIREADHDREWFHPLGYSPVIQRWEDRSNDIIRVANLRTHNIWDMGTKQYICIFCH